MHPDALLWHIQIVDIPGKLLGPIEFTRSIWRCCQSKFPLSSEASSMALFLLTHLLSFRVEGVYVAPWLHNNLSRFVDIVHFRSRELIPFEELRGKINLPNRAHFQYLQIKHFLTSLYGTQRVSIPTLCKLSSSTKGLISAIYAILNNPPQGTEPRHLYMLSHGIFTAGKSI